VGDYAFVTAYIQLRTIRKTAASNFAVVEHIAAAHQPLSAGSAMDSQVQEVSKTDTRRSSMIQINTPAIQQFLQATMPVLLSPVPATAAESDCSPKTRQPEIRLIVS
jgi:hypothetical protein